jgi:RNA polymerase sigma factor (sigma-70 family)
MKWVWWMLPIAALATSASAIAQDGSANEARAATRKKIPRCATAVTEAPRRQPRKPDDSALLPFESRDPGTVMAAAAWLQFRGYRPKQIAARLAERRLFVGDGDEPVTEAQVAELVAGHQAIARERASQWSNRRGDTPLRVIRWLHAANLDDEAISAFLNERKIAWKDRSAADAGDAAETADGEGENEAPPKDTLWTAERVREVRESPERAGIVYHEKFTDEAAMEAIVASAMTIRDAAEARFFAAMAREDADPVFAMPPLPESSQQTLFLAMNYLRYRATLDRERLGPFLEPNDHRLADAVRREKMAAALYDVLHRSNTRLVREAAKAFMGLLDLDDMIGEGQLGLQRAIETFDVRRGFKFSTHATNCIKNVLRHAYTHGQREMRGGGVLHVSLDQATDPDGESYLPEPVDFRERQVLGELIQREGMAGLDARLDELDERKARILRMRFGLDGPEYTLKEVGEILGITRERVRQIEGDALNELAEKFGAPPPRPKRGK